MNKSIQYVTNAEGKQSAVIVPIGEWEKLQDKYRKLKNKLEVLKGLQEAVAEVNDIKKGKKKGKTLEEVLGEC
jgi:PHD/YefM family antitoxin component YafN of YafNO toxin-antitoxin module